MRTEDTQLEGRVGQFRGMYLSVAIAIRSLGALSIILQVPIYLSLKS